MGLVKRQTSNPGSYTVNYGGFDSPRSNLNMYSKSERSFFDDLEGEAKIQEMPLRDSRKKKMKSKNQIPQRLLFNIIQYAVFFYVLLRTRRASINLRKTNDDLSVMNKDYEVLQEMLEETEFELKQAHDDFLKLQVRVNTMTPHTEIHRGIKNSNDRKVLTDTIVDRHNAQAKRIDNMQKAIQEIHRRDLIQKYGKGPYEIEVAVNLEGEQKYFTIETAPIDLMPHAIHTFMDSVISGVWDNTLFIHKVDHVILAAPIDDEGNQKSPELTKTLLFPEYSEEFPHVEHTIGFQGRPGGPEIYVNLDDNSKHHGPGGQKHHDLVEEADPCFGKITHGIDVLTKFIGINSKAVRENTVSTTKIVYMRYVRKN